MLAKTHGVVPLCERDLIRTSPNVSTKQDSASRSVLALDNRHATQLAHVLSRPIAQPSASIALSRSRPVQLVKTGRAIQTHIFNQQSAAFPAPRPPDSKVTISFTRSLSR